jgi:hypothetical protein
VHWMSSESTSMPSPTGKSFSAATRACRRCELEADVLPGRRARHLLEHQVVVRAAQVADETIPSRRGTARAPASSRGRLHRLPSGPSVAAGVEALPIDTFGLPCRGRRGGPVELQELHADSPGRQACRPSCCSRDQSDPEVEQIHGIETVHCPGYRPNLDFSN